MEIKSFRATRIIALMLLMLFTAVLFFPVTAYASALKPHNEEARAFDAGEKYSLTVGQQNIVLRARQVFEIEWTPLRDVIKWGRRGVFRAGETVQGLPYGMPLEENYVPFGTSFSEFLAEVNDINSRFYRSVATRHREAPFFSLDCSAFVSWAWGLETRHMTGALPSVSINIGRNIQNLQVGDAINSPGLHVLLVTELQYDADGEISAVGLMELDPPQAQFVLFGEGGDFSLNDIRRRYLDEEFTIIRHIDRGSVVYLHDCAVPLDGDYCIECIVFCESAPLPLYLDMHHRSRHIDLVKFINQLGLHNGTSHLRDTFDYTMTRGMFVYLLSQNADRAVINIKSDDKPIFADVPTEEWYASAIAWAADIGIIETKNNLFEPRRMITHEEMAQIIYSYTRWRIDKSPTSAPLVFLAA